MEKTKININISPNEADIDDSLFNVIMHNDDVTPFDYVAFVMITVFGHQAEAAVELTLHIHHNGKAIVATLPMEEAYARVEAVDELNQKFGFLLQTTVETA